MKSDEKRRVIGDNVIVAVVAVAVVAVVAALGAYIAVFAGTH